MKSELYFLAGLLFLVMATMVHRSDAGCADPPTKLKVCVVPYQVPDNDNDVYGDSVAFNAISTHGLSKSCAQVYADYICAVQYPTCVIDSDSGATVARNACQSLCNQVNSNCNGQLDSLDCSKYPTSSCTSNSATVALFYPPPPGLSKGAIAGIVIGVIVGVALIVVIVIVVVRKGKSGPPKEPRAKKVKEPKPKKTTEKVDNKDKDKKEKDLEAGETNTGNSNIGKHASTDSGFLSVAVGGNATEMKERSPNDARARARAPESPSPRASLTLVEPIGKSRDSRVVSTNSNSSSNNNKSNRGSVTEITREAKIKAQLDALPEAHRSPPAPWGIHYTDDGDLYFWNSETDESVWEYPL